MRALIGCLSLIAHILFTMTGTCQGQESWWENAPAYGRVHYPNHEVFFVGRSDQMDSFASAREAARKDAINQIGEYISTSVSIEEADVQVMSTRASRVSTVGASRGARTAFSNFALRECAFPLQYENREVQDTNEFGYPQDYWVSYVLFGFDESTYRRNLEEEIERLNILLNRRLIEARELAKLGLLNESLILYLHTYDRLCSEPLARQQWISQVRDELFQNWTQIKSDCNRLRVVLRSLESGDQHRVTVGVRQGAADRSILAQWTKDIPVFFRPEVVLGEKHALTKGSGEAIVYFRGGFDRPVAVRVGIDFETLIFGDQKDTWLGILKKYRDTFQGVLDDFQDWQKKDIQVWLPKGVRCIETLVAIGSLPNRTYSDREIQRIYQDLGWMRFENGTDEAIGAVLSFLALEDIRAVACEEGPKGARYALYPSGILDLMVQKLNAVGGLGNIETAREGQIVSVRFSEESLSGFFARYINTCRGIQEVPVDSPAAADSVLVTAYEDLIHLWSDLAAEEFMRPAESQAILAMPMENIVLASAREGLYEHTSFVSSLMWFYSNDNTHYEALCETYGLKQLTDADEAYFAGCFERCLEILDNLTGSNETGINYARVHYRRGMALLDWTHTVADSIRKANALQAAEQAFQTVLRLSPNHSGALVGLGEVALRNNDLYYARDLFEAVGELADAPLADVAIARHAGLAEIALIQGDSSAARQAYREARKCFLSDPPVQQWPKIANLLRLAQLAQSLGDLWDAFELRAEASRLRQAIDVSCLPAIKSGSPPKAPLVQVSWANSNDRSTACADFEVGGLYRASRLDVDCGGKETYILTRMPQTVRHCIPVASGYNSVTATLHYQGADGENRTISREFFYYLDK